MSDNSNSHDDGPHEGPIKTPKQLIVAILVSFVLPVVAIVLLASYVTDDKRPAAGSDAFTAESVAKRIAPVGRVVVKDLSNLATLKTGEQVYAAQCSACHAAGLAGSPKFGDTAAWAPRVATGYDALVNSALKGKNAMGAQGGGDYSDIEVGRAVVYMANKGGANFAEPQPQTAAPAGEPATPSAATTAAAPAMTPSR
jgi:cytochrome c5